MKKIKPFENEKSRKVSRRSHCYRIGDEKEKKKEEVEEEESSKEEEEEEESAATEVDQNELEIVEDEESARLPPNWVKVRDPTSKDCYYANTVTQESTWEFPSS